MSVSMDSASAQDYRRALGAYATGVAVVTTASAGGAIAITINSFASVSLAPRLVLWSLGDQSDAYDAYAGAERFGISVLSDKQEALARGFADEGRQALSQSDLSLLADTPVLPVAIARFACRTYEQRTLGDHLLIVGEVLDFDMIPGDGLTYFRSRFGRAPTPQS